jgi:tetratricopeptide (TPR) repeat protein
VTRRRYPGWFAAVLVVLGLTAVYVISKAREVRDAAPVLTSAEAEAGQGAPLTLEIGDPALIQPSADAYERFAAEDASWRSKHAPRVSARHFAVATGASWRPSARDMVRDSAFALARRGQLHGAITVLESWVDANPRDAELLLELARLLNQAGRTDASLARYRELLALDRRKAP